MEELELKGIEKENYINLVIQCLTFLIKEFQKKNYEEMINFNQSIINFFNLLKYNEEPKKGDFLGIFDNLKVDPVDCGFPSFESRYLIWRLKEVENGVERFRSEVCLLEEQINRKYMDIFFDETSFTTLPEISILEKIVNIREHNEKKFIFNSDEPLWLRRLDFLDRLRNIDIPSNCECKLDYMKTEGKERYYQIIIRGFDDAKKLWAMYEIVLTCFPVRWKTEPIDKTHRPRPEFMEKLKTSFSRDPGNLYIYLSGLDCIQPKLIKRCEIGPFYYPKTENKRFVKDLFEDKKFPFLMCYRLEYLSDQDAVGQNLKQSGDAKDQAVGMFANYLIPVVDKIAIGSDAAKGSSGPVKSQNYFICPQELRNDLISKIKFYDNFKVLAI